MKQNFNSNNQILQISGLYPGVGKSYLIEHWYNTLKEDGYNVEVCATTHRGSTISGKTATSLFESNYSNLLNNTFIPTLHRNTKKIFIVDEAYLWSKVQWNKIFAAFPNSKFILVGDDAQFTPVDGNEPLEPAKIYLNKIHRQSDQLFIKFISDLKAGKIDIDYIKKNCYRRQNKKYIAVSFTKEIAKTLQSTVSLKHSYYYYDELYSYDSIKWFTLSSQGKQQATVLLGNEFDRKGINLHQLQGLTLSNTDLALDIHIDDYLLKHLDVLLRFLYVAFTRVVDINQIYISSNEIQKIENILSLFDKLKKNCYEINELEIDSSDLAYITSDEIADLFNKYGTNPEKSLQVVYGMTKFEQILEERFFNPIYGGTDKKAGKVYKPINPMNRKTWAKKPNDIDGCISHHWYCFECDYPKNSQLTEEEWSNQIKEQINKWSNYFFCVIYSGHQSYHCFVYNDYEATQEEYNSLWDSMNKLFFDNMADTACKCYNPHLVRAPFVIRPDTGKEQRLVKFTGNCWNFTRHLSNVKETKQDPERIIIKEAIADRDSIDAEIAWISNTWELTTVDGTSRYNKLCSIADNISAWKYRKLTAEAIVEVITKVGQMMNLSSQRIQSVINANHSKIYNFDGQIVEDSFTEERYNKSMYNQFRHQNAIDLANRVFHFYNNFAVSVKYYLWYCNTYRIGYDFNCLKAIKNFTEKINYFSLFDKLKKNCYEINENQGNTFAKVLNNKTSDEIREMFKEDEEVDVYKTKSEAVKNRTEEHKEHQYKSVSLANKAKRQKFWNLLPKDYNNLSQAEIYQIFKDNGIKTSSASQAAKKIKTGEWLK